MEKLFAVAGVSTHEGTTKPRFANDIPSRVQILERVGHTDIKLIDLPNPMTKVDAISFLLKDKNFQDTASHSALLSNFTKRQETTEIMERRVAGRTERAERKTAQATPSDAPKRRPGRPRKNPEAMTTATGTQGGTHEQHVNAGKQSHKNDAMASEPNTGQATATQTKTRGGTHEQHVQAGQQSHKNDVMSTPTQSSRPLMHMEDVSPNTKRTVATKKENTTTDLIENVVEERVLDNKDGPKVMKERTVSEHTVHTAEIVDTVDVNYKTSHLAYEHEGAVG